MVISCHYFLLLTVKVLLPSNHCILVISISAIEKQKSAHTYENYSYEYTMLKPFTVNHEGKQFEKCMNTSDHVNGQVSKKSSNAFSSRNLSSSARFGSRKMKMSSKAQSTYIRGIWDVVGKVLSILFSQLASRSQLIKPQEEEEGNFALFCLSVLGLGCCFWDSPLKNPT